MMRPVKGRTFLPVDGVVTTRPTPPPSVRCGDKVSATELVRTCEKLKSTRGARTVFTSTLGITWCGPSKNPCSSENWERAKK